MLVSAGASLLALDCVAATFTVTSTNDTGAGSLRQVILDANASPGADSVHFNIGSATLTIIPLSTLPSITDPVTIDGTTQPGFAGAPIVELNGTSAGSAVDGLRIAASNCTVRGLLINRFQGDGIEIAGRSNAVVGCVIGLDAAGVDRGNNLSGIVVSNAFNVIGGAAVGEGNVISGNAQYGIALQGTNAASNLVLGNIIGLTATGSVARANTRDGVLLNNAPSNTVGGAASGARNVISGNFGDGIEINGAAASGNLVLGNFIGTDLNGTAARPNSGSAVLLQDARNNTIGGAAAGTGNLLSGNFSGGITVSGAGATNNLVLGNFIGTDASGAAALGNSSVGVQFSGSARFNRVGGTNVGEANVIAFNNNVGLSFGSGTNNAARANAIFANAQLGIDISPTGVTTNDPGDGDGGVNFQQNFPTLTAATNSASTIIVAGTLNSRANTGYGVDFFSNLDCDSSGHGEGQTYLGSTNVTTDGAGNAAFLVTFAQALTGRYLTATATDPNGNTSEFSPCVASVSTIAGMTFTVVNTNDTGAGSLRQAIINANAAITAGDTIAFNIPGAGPHTIAPGFPLPTLSDLGTTIDGYTQPGASANTLTTSNDAAIKIRLHGGNAGFGTNGLRLASSNLVVRGLCLIRFNTDAIGVANNGHNVIEGNFIGIDVDGATMQANTGNGVFLNRAFNNRIGGTTPAARNLIAGNSSAGVALQGPGASGNVVQGNLVGVNAAVTLKRGNANGITIFDAENNVIGGATPGAANVLAGNVSGASFSGNATNNQVLGNFIGTDPTGTLNLGNSLDGIAFTGGRGNVIGGVIPGQGNLIAFNNVKGVELTIFNATNNAIRGNAIHSHNGLGINLSSSGIVTTNDPGDADTGPNLLQNFPLLTAATNRASETIIHGTLNSRANTTYALDFFANLACDASGHGEGMHFLGSASATTDGAGNASFSVMLPVLARGRFITATATDPTGNTSEFSACREAVSEIAPGMFQVTNTNDSGSGSLRQAILSVNASPSAANFVTFNIPGAGPHTIAPLSALPAPTQPVTIDGFTQPGASANTLASGNNAAWLVRLDGVSAPFGTDGLRLNINGVVVRGLIVTRFSGEGVEISGGTGSRVEGSCIVSNGPNGVLINGAAGHLVGGVSPAARNVISANAGNGVNISGAGASNNMVQGNFIGTDRTGLLDRGNAIVGVTVSERGNLIGGMAPGAGNVISGNNNHGVSLSGFAATGNTVQGNRIGTDATGTLAVGNSVDGVNIASASGNRIGGTAPGAGNLVSGNGVTGITITGNGAISNVVQVNLVGTDVSGANPLPNGSHGIALVSGASRNRIGGSGNVIAFNNGDGVAVLTGTNNAIRHNSIFDNTGLGIDLANEFANNGVTTNDLNDADSGPNFLQNFPLLTAATANPANTVISGTLNSRPNTAYALDFFSSPACDDSGHGEGRSYLGITNVTTDGGGNVSFTVTLPVVLTGRQVTATATDASGNTSEFSPCQPAASTILPQNFVVTNTNDDGPGSLRRALLNQNQAVSASNNMISFNIPGPGPHVIRPLTPLPPGLEAATFDGFTQPGSSPNTATNDINNAVIQIVIEGTAGGAPGAGFAAAAAGGPRDGFVVRGDGSILKGIHMRSHTGNGLNVLANDVVLAGIHADLNGQDGILIARGTGNRVGGTAPGDACDLQLNGGHGLSFLGTATSDNVAQKVTTIFNQLNGIRIASSSGNWVSDCLINANSRNGVEISGTSARGNIIEESRIKRNADNGVRIDRSANNRIGRDNVFDDNQRNGVDIEGTTAAGNEVHGNMILRSGLNGVGISQAPSNTVMRNVIGQSDNDGVNISGSAATRNVVAENLIGQTEAERLGNERAGVTVTANATDNLVGPENTISFNKGDGVLVQLGAVRNRITANSISANDQLGIDLDTNEVTPNDGPGDPDAGGNLRQNFPILTRVCWDGANLLIFGRLISAPNTLFQVEFFLNAVCDPSLHGEGERFIGVAPVMTDNTGQADFSVSVGASGVTADSILTCTATDPFGNTSEFSPCFTPFESKAPIIFLTVTNFNDDGPGSLRDALRRSNAHFASNLNVIIFVLPGPGPFRIPLLSALPPITQPVSINGCNQPTNGSGGGFLAAGTLPDCKVILDGRNAGKFVNGLEITARGSGSEIRNLTIENFPGHGIKVGDVAAPSDNNVIQASCIWSNAGHGIGVFGSNNLLGGTNESDFNQLFRNGGAGAAILSGLGNSFFSLCGDNGGSGFDLGGDGLTENDPDDLDFGPNALQNYLKMNTAFTTSSNTTVKFTFTGKSNTAYIFTFTTSATDDPSRHGEGERHLGVDVVRTDANGQANVTSVFRKPSTPGHLVSATTTCPDNGTSEFGRNVPVAPGNAADLGVNTRGNTNRVRLGGFLICSNEVSNFGPADATGVLATFSPCAEIVSFNVSQGSAAVVGGKLMWNVGNLPVDAMATMVATTRVTNDTPAVNTNTFSATAAQPDPNPDNNAMTKLVDVLPALPGQADLAVNVQSDITALVGGNITSTIGVNNTSSNAANNVMLMAILPHGAQLNFSAGPVTPRVSTPIEKLVNQIFMDLTGRPASLTELSSFAAAIVSGSLTPFDLAFSLINSTAYRRSLTEELYDAYLNRQPTSQELAMALSFFSADNDTEDFIVQLLGSDEFFDNTLGDFDDFIDELFDELLPDKEPSERQLDDLDDILTDVNDRTQRERAARYVLGTSAYCRRLAEYVAIRYGRYDEGAVEDDDPPDIVFELQDLWRDGAPEEVLIAHMMDSADYAEIARCVLFFDKGTMPGGASFQTIVDHTSTRPGPQNTTAAVSSDDDPNQANNISDAPTVVRPPAASIQRIEGTVIVKWPADVRGFSVETTHDADSNDWTPVTRTEFSDDRMCRQVTLVADKAVQFFRLTTAHFDYCIEETVHGDRFQLAFNSLTGDFCIRCPDGTLQMGKGETRWAGTPEGRGIVISGLAGQSGSAIVNLGNGTGSASFLCDGQIVRVMDLNIDDNDCRCE